MDLDIIDDNCGAIHIRDKKTKHDLNLKNEKNKSKQNPDYVFSNVIFLIILYTLQGFPIGVVEAFSVSLQLKGASYKSLGLFSFAFWPFSLKLIWAPIVDSVYFKKIGRRKSWLIPVQLMLGISFIYLSSEIDFIMKHVKEGSTIAWFTAILTFNMFLAATQDIAVDGWALSILSEDCISLASTCNSVGQTLGFVIANLSFLLLTSDSFCSKYLFFIVGNTKIATESQLFIIFGLTFIITTILVAIFIPEQDSLYNVCESNTYSNIVYSYTCLWKYFNLAPIKKLMCHLLFYKIGFAAIDAITGRKLIEVGLDKNILAMMSLPIIMVQLILPFIVDKYVSLHGPLSIQLKIYPLRLFHGFISFILFYIATHIKSSSSNINSLYPFPLWFHIFIPAYMMYVSSMAFFAQVSDPEHGGAQMTLLNTICNLGTKWPNSFALFTLDFLTIRKCITKKEETNFLNECNIMVDGFYVQLIICFCIGLFWFIFMRKSFYSLQNVKKEDWQIKSKID